MISIFSIFSSKSLIKLLKIREPKIDNCNSLHSLSLITGTIDEYSLSLNFELLCIHIYQGVHFIFNYTVINTSWGSLSNTLLMSRYTFLTNHWGNFLIKNELWVRFVLDKSKLNSGNYYIIFNLFIKMDTMVTLWAKNWPCEVYYRV